MDNIITISNFEGRYSLSVTTYGTETLNDFITQYQYDLLIDMLGTELYNTYNNDDTLAAWLALKNGSTGYTDYCGYVRNWRGLADLMVPYIFSHYIIFNSKKAVQSGSVKPKFQNADVLSEFQLKQMAYQAWNDFVNKWNECYNFLYTNNSTYTDFELHFKQKYNQGIIVKGQIT